MRRLCWLALGFAAPGCGLVLGADWDGTLAPEMGGGGSDAGSDGGCGGGCPGAPVTAVATGDEFTCAIVQGAVRCWGWNVFGTLGTGSDFETLRQSATPVEVVGLSSGVTHLAAKVSHACAVADGNVKCWGSNSHGQLGAPNLEEAPAPVTVAGLGGPATQVAVGWSHSCAIVDGALYCWGWNEFGQIGNGTTSVDPVSPTVVIESGVTDVGAGALHTCAVVSGAVRCWGQFAALAETSPTPIAGLGQSTAIDAAGGFAGAMTCAVSEGAAWCWGSSDDGALGHPGKTFLLEPSAVPGIPSGASDIAVSDRHVCSIVLGGAWCWGLYPGNGTSASDIAVNVGAGLNSGVTSIGVSEDHACAVKDSALFCWGSNSSGQLGVPGAEMPEALTPLRIRL